MKNATFRQIKVFEAVARHLNYSRAAEELRLSQPAVSIHVKQLERHAGLPLFEQLGRKIYLTSAGQQMLHYSRAIIQQLREADEALAAQKGIRGGVLNIAVISAGDYFFPGLLAEFCRRHEDVTVRLTVNNREEIVRQLVENTTDLTVLLRPPENPEMIAEAFAPQPHVIIAAPGHALTRKRHISLQTLAKEAFIVRERGSDTRLAMEELLAEFHVKFNVTMEIKSTETIKQAVIAGMGISFLSAHTIGRDLKAGRLSVLDVEGFPVMRKWHIVHHKNKRLPAVAVAFKEFLLQEGAVLIERLVGRAVPKRKPGA
jgi:DNA-binding transcriptional LysR family regulator